MVEAVGETVGRAFVSEESGGRARRRRSAASLEVTQTVVRPPEAPRATEPGGADVVADAEAATRPSAGGESPSHGASASDRAMARARAAGGSATNGSATVWLRPGGQELD